ncbi:MAG: hypothetical protein JKY88_15425 [Pseudomonadales bacterium]|nr:hypothetical protein [Pseudomonadales bacterium]
MAKAASPVRLENTLMNEAKVAGSVLHRSAAEQIEYWADIGRKVSKVIDPETLLALNAGLVKITVTETPQVIADPEAVFAALDRDRDSGALSDAIAAKDIRYQASTAQPGLLEQVHPDGQILVGQFVNGEFQLHDGL